MPTARSFSLLSAAVAAAICCLAPLVATAQSTEDSGTSIPADTFGDAAARQLILTARTALDAGARGLQSYEARMTERMRVGVSVGPGLSRRGRTLYSRERVAEVWWSAEETGVMKWIGERTQQPALGEGEGLFGLDIDVERELDLDDIRAPIPFDPYADRLDVLDADFIQPVSREGLQVYRFQSGDTLRISLPSGDQVVLVEVLVEPRFEAWETVTGSLWFDADSGRLVRATYRPSGVWDHDVQEPGDLDDVPGVLKPAIGRVDFIVLEYGLYEQRYWLPRKLSAEGVFEWGRGLVRMPLQVEWTVGQYLVDEAPSAATLPTQDDIRRGMRGNDERRMVVYSRPLDQLTTAPELPEPIGAGEVGPFTKDELAPLLERLDASTLSGRSAARTTLPPWYWRTATATRYDRVRGPSLGVQRSGIIWESLAADAALRIGAADPEPSVELRFRKTTNADRRPSPGSPVIGLGRMVTRRPEGEPRAAPGIWMSGYHRLAEANGDWGGVGSLGNSVLAALAGHDDGEYYWSSGAEAGVGAGGPNAGISVAAFVERHRIAATETDFSLATLGSDQLRANLVADEGDFFGVRLAAGAQAGVDPTHGVVVVDATIEAAAGDREYGRGLLTVTGMHPVFGLPAALRVSAGTSSADAPLQRQFHLGGTTTVRGFQGGALQGSSFVATRAELGTRVAMIRVAGFMDAAWVGEPMSRPTSRPIASVGTGLSFFDGLFRFDLARGIRGGSGWRLHLYLDGVL